jgi:hypothetical protein
MPGKGAARSRSTPRERPGSASMRPQSPFGGESFSRSLAYAGERSPSRAGERSPSRSGTPPAGGQRRLSSLSLSGTSGLNDCSLNSTYGQERCICGICTCGRHKCPVQSKTAISYGSYGGDSHFCTTHGDAFVNHDSNHYAPQRATRAQQIYSPGERFDHTTTHQDTFLWHERERPSSAMREHMERSTRPTSLHGHGSDARMDLTTSYGSHFVEHPIPSKSMKPSQASYAYGSPREFLTTKQLDYSGLQHARCPATVLPARPGSARSGHVKYNMDLSGTWS